MCSTKAPWYSTATTSAPGRVRRLRRERHLVRAEHDVDVDVAPPQPGTVDTTPISQVSSAWWTWARQEVGVAHERRDEARRRLLEDAVRACRPARSDPSRMTTTRSPIDSASVWSWVTKIAVVPVSRSTADRVGADLRAERLVEGGERLVEEYDGRPRRQGTGQRHPLLLAAGQLVRVAAGQVAQPDQLEHLGDPAAPRRGAGASRSSPKRDVAGRRQVREQRVVLEDQADPAPLRVHARAGPGDLVAGDAGSRRRRAARARRSAAAAVDLPQPEGPIRVSSSPGGTDRSRSRAAAHGAVRLRDALEHERGAVTSAAPTPRSPRTWRPRRAPAGTAGTPARSPAATITSAGSAACSQKFSFASW